MYTCKFCGKEAKWKSPIYVSPLCNDCAEKEVAKLIAEKNTTMALEVDDFYLKLSREVELAQANLCSFIFTPDKKDIE